MTRNWNESKKEWRPGMGYEDSSGIISGNRVWAENAVVPMYDDMPKQPIQDSTPNLNGYIQGSQDLLMIDDFPGMKENRPGYEYYVIHNGTGVLRSPEWEAR